MFKSFLYFLLFTTAINYGQSEFKFANNKKKIVIPFQLINNLVFVPLTLNGEELTFLLDTGVEQTVILSIDETQDLQLYDVETMKLRGLGSSKTVDGYKSSNNRVELNGFVDSKHELYVILDQEFNFSAQIGIPVNGILGYHFFKNHLVEIDYQHKKVIIHREKSTKLTNKLKRKFHKDSISIELNKPYLVTEIKQNEKTIKSKLLLDTGNSDAVWLFSNDQKKIAPPIKNIDDYLGRGFSGNVHGKRGRIQNFKFGNKTFENPIVTFPDSTSLKSVSFVPNRLGSIGGEVISRFNVFFDYKEQAIYTFPNNKINEPFSFNMSGIDIEHAGLEWGTETVQERRSGIKIYTNKDTSYEPNFKFKFTLKPIFKIFSVRVASEAEKAGLKKGDKIIRINGTHAHNLSIERINKLLKEEDGRMIFFEVERNGKKLKIRFPLKNIL